MDRRSAWSLVGCIAFTPIGVWVTTALESGVVGSAIIGAWFGAVGVLAGMAAAAIQDGPSGGGG